jgi:hypothetical protein
MATRRERAAQNRAEAEAEVLALALELERLERTYTTTGLRLRALLDPNDDLTASVLRVIDAFEY